MKQTMKQIVRQLGILRTLEANRGGKRRTRTGGRVQSR